MLPSDRCPAMGCAGFSSCRSERDISVACKLFHQDKNPLHLSLFSRSLFFCVFSRIGPSHELVKSTSLIWVTAPKPPNQCSRPPNHYPASLNIIRKQSQRHHHGCCC